MKIETVDFFYLAMPNILDIGDGSQDALLVRIRAGDYEGWGECEASPLTSIAGYVCPMSHSACKPVGDSVLGQRLDTVDDIVRIGREIRQNSFDLLQTDHILSGIDIALWDLLGKKEQAPVYSLLGYSEAFQKRAYASALFQDTPEGTRNLAETLMKKGFQAVKFGWGPFGKNSATDDEAQVEGAREGLGNEIQLMVDAGTIWGEDVETAQARIPVLEACKVSWLEEPFEAGALHAYAALARQTTVPIAGGEGSHNRFQARHLIDHGGISVIQIDTGRIGGITPARETAIYADEKKLHYVNHTFTTPLALSASVQPYAGFKDHDLCEFPVQPSSLAATLTTEGFSLTTDGFYSLSNKPGLGVDVDVEVLRTYLMDVEINVNGTELYKTPQI